MTEGYKLLAAAIIKQCLLDYREALQEATDLGYS